MPKKLKPEIITQEKWIYILLEIGNQINPNIKEHHHRVAYLCYSIGKDLELSNNSLLELTQAGLLHDIGGVATKNQYETNTHDIFSNNHPDISWEILSYWKPFQKSANLIKLHHPSSDSFSLSIPHQIIQISEWFAIEFEKNKDISSILKKLNNPSTEYNWSPIIITSLKKQISQKKQITILESPTKFKAEEYISFEEMPYTYQTLEKFSLFFSKILHLFNPDLANHSISVSNISYELGKQLNYSETTLTKLKIAAIFHDTGKITIPSHILEKPSELTDREFECIKNHPLYTEKILSSLPNIKDIIQWASFHHENLEGTGYPYGIKEPLYSKEAQCITIADMYASLRETRPYKRSYSSKESLLKIKSKCPHHLELKILKLLE